jgi:hypothetical protein
MANLSKWNITIENGPTGSDSYDFTVSASSAKDALTKAEQWAKDNNVLNPMFGEPYEDTYEDLLEWTAEDEEEFIHIVIRSDNIDES